MKNTKSLSLFFILLIILLTFNKIHANFYVSTSPNNISTIIISNNMKYHNNNNNYYSSYFMRLSDDIIHYYCSMNNNHKKYNTHDFLHGNTLLSCENFRNFLQCEEQTPTVTLNSTLATADYSGVSSHITKANTLTYAMLALLCLMMPNGAPHDYFDADGPVNNNNNNNNDDDNDNDNDNDDDNETSSSDNEDDIVVYTYDSNAQNPNQYQGKFGFVTDISETLTWKNVANSLQDDYISVYGLQENYVDSVDDDHPRLCCFGYYARYFRYGNPHSENDSGEPLQEFSPELNDWLLQVKPYVNRINLYRMECNGFS